MAPPQPTRPSPFHFENLNASSSAGAPPTVTLQLIDRVQGQRVAASRNQQNGTSSFVNTQLQLGGTPPGEYIEKNLTRSDVDRIQCRLLLPKRFVESILSSMDIPAAAQKCGSTEGFPIDVFDVDDNRRSFVLRLKQWSSNSYVLTGNWIENFVDRKGLREGDTVGLRYYKSNLYFKHFENHN